MAPAARNADGNTVLWLACVSNDPDTVDALIAAESVTHPAGHTPDREVAPDSAVAARAHRPARRAVLAMPLRLIAERVRFEPALDTEPLGTLERTPTWMVARAKAARVYQDAQWRADGQSGGALVRHEQAVLNEVYDTCDIAAAWREFSLDANALLLES